MYTNYMTKNGVSTTKTPGQEQYQKFTGKEGGFRSKPYVQYDYRHLDGALFSCVKPTLDACRAARDAWLDKKKRRAFE